MKANGDSVDSEESENNVRTCVPELPVEFGGVGENQAVCDGSTGRRLGL